MTAPTRRGLFALLAGAAAAPLVKAATAPACFSWNGYEIGQVTRHDFAPRIVPQLYTQLPLRRAGMSDINRVLYGYDAPDSRSFGLASLLTDEEYEDAIS